VSGHTQQLASAAAAAAAAATARDRCAMPTNGHRSKARRSVCPGLHHRTVSLPPLFARTARGRSTEPGERFAKEKRQGLFNNETVVPKKQKG